MEAVKQACIISGLDIKSMQLSSLTRIQKTE